MRRTLQYGAHPDQVGDLYLGEGRGLPLLVLLHGGFWRMPYGRDEFDAIIPDLAAAGYSIWNAEYRRVGGAGGWPETGADAVAAVEFARDLEVDGRRPAAQGIVLIGFSAGGHLAFWAASELARRGSSGVRGVIGLAPVVDLVMAAELRLGDDAAAALLGGGPAERRARYVEASPRERLPLGVPQVIIHGTADRAVPIGMSRGYVAAARGAGDGVVLDEVAGGGHGDHLDAASVAHQVLRRVLREP